MNFLLQASVVLLFPALQGQSPELKEYLHIRRSYGIIESVGVPALETLVGTRVFEVQGTIKGTLKSGGKMSILLERTDGETEAIDATSIPDWAVGTNESARLIIKATRTDENGEIKASLISVAREDDILPIESAMLAKAAKTASAHRKTAVTSSRHSDSNRIEPPSKAPEKVWTVPSDDATPYYAGYIHKRNPKLSNSEAYRMAEGILGFSRRYGVDARLIVAMVICESDFNPNEVSNKGAMGLGQLMPDTAHDYGITNPFDSVQNLYGTVREIRAHIDKYRGETGDEFQSLVLGLAAYNAGDGAVHRHHGIPPYKETQAYVRKVVKLFYYLKGYR